MAREREARLPAPRSLVEAMPLNKSTARRKRLALEAIFSVLAAVAWSSHQLSYGQSKADARIYRGIYSNPIFGYSVSLPSGLVGEGDPDPAPNHGIVVRLSSDGVDYLWTSGLYNASYYNKPEQLAEDQLDELKGEGLTDVKVVSLEHAALCDLQALRQTISYRTKAGALMTQVIVSAVDLSDHGPGMLYSVGLRSSSDTLPRNIKMLDQVVSSFRCFPPNG